MWHPAFSKYVKLGGFFAVVITFVFATYVTTVVAPNEIEGTAVWSRMTVLGALIIDNNAIDKVADLLKSEDFYNEGHRLIYEHINRLAVDSHPADAVTVSESLRAAGKLDYVGGLAYIGALQNAVPTAANAARYAKIVSDRAKLRGLAAVGTEVEANHHISVLDGRQWHTGSIAHNDRLYKLIGNVFIV